MSRGVTAILYSPGTNCHEETAAAIEFAGGRTELVLLRDLLDGRTRLRDYQAAVIPGGFSYGDHLGAGRIFATMLVACLRHQLEEFLEARKPLLGICNGFQVLTESGILPGRTPGKRRMALLENQSAHFEDRKIRLLVSAENCAWTEGLGGEILEMPTAHGEGRPLFCDAADAAARVVFRYTDAQGRPTMEYPSNPILDAYPAAQHPGRLPDRRTELRSCPARHPACSDLGRRTAFTRGPGSRRKRGQEYQRDSGKIWNIVIGST